MIDIIILIIVLGLLVPLLSMREGKPVKAKRRKRSRKPRASRDASPAGAAPSGGMAEKTNPGSRSDRRTRVDQALSALPVSPRSLIPGPFVSGYADADYCIVNNVSFNPATANGLSTRKADILAAYYRAASYDEVKDWTSTEQANITARDLACMEFVQALKAQANIRVINPQFCTEAGDDAKAIWTDDGWESFIQELGAANLRIPRYTAQIVMALNPIFQYSQQWDARSFPPGYFIPYAPTYTLAEARTAIATISNLNSGLPWLRKISQFNMVNPLSCLTPRIRPWVVDNETAFFWSLHSYYKSSGSQTLLPSPFGDASAGDIADTWYFFAPGTYPHFLYNFLTWLSPYDAANNPRGCAVANAESIPGYTQGADDLNWLFFKFVNNSSTITTVTYANGFSRYANLMGCLYYQMLDTLGAGNVYEYGALLGMHRQQTSAGVWADAPVNGFIRLMTTRRISVRTPRAKKEASNDGVV